VYGWPRLKNMNANGYGVYGLQRRLGSRLLTNGLGVNKWDPRPHLVARARGLALNGS
jgi:hypothetical protein